MRGILLTTIFSLLAADVFGQSNEPPLSDTRLTVHTLVREDVFAGWRTNNMDRLERAERNIELLLEQRPAAKATLLAWKGGAKIYRAVLAHESGNSEKFQDYYSQANELFTEARRLDRQDVGVCAVCGGSLVMFGDRLPEDVRDAAWADAWDDYQVIWAQQSDALTHLPVHISGELLAGLAHAAQRTGRDEELTGYLDKIIEVLPDTPYARVAKEWKADPQAPGLGKLACRSCHAPGRLRAKLKKFEVDGN